MDIVSAEITGCKYHPGTRIRYGAWCVERGARDAAVYILLEHEIGEMVAILKPMMESGMIPPGMVVTVDSGSLPATLPGGADRAMRACEFDQPGRDFPDFIVEELVPAVAESLGVEVSKSPDVHFITGGSSGGIAAWNAAWYRNDFFHRVFLSSPTFSAMRGGEEIMPVVRKCETRPLRVFMTVGSVEPDYFFGDSFLVALNAAGALKHAGYDFRFEVFEHEGHCARRSDPGLWSRMMDFLFADWRTGVVERCGNPPRVKMLLAPGSKWRECDFRMPMPVRSALSTDGWRRYSVSPDSRFVTAESIMPDGSVSQKYANSNLHVAWNATSVGGYALAVLADDRVLVATDIGVQGVVSFGLTDLILPLPGDLPADNIFVDGTTLYVSSQSRVFKRELAIAGADPSEQSQPHSPGYGDGPYSREHLPIQGMAGGNSIPCR